MVKETMKVQEALKEINKIEKVTERMLKKGVFFAVKQKNSDVIDGVKTDEIKESIENDYNKIQSMIARRDALKKAVSKSNSETKVTVSGKEYSISEAISIKGSNNVLYKLFYDTMLQQLNKEEDNCTEDKELFDPLNLKDKLREIEQKRMLLDSEINAALNRSNSITEISITY